MKSAFTRPLSSQREIKRKKKDFVVRVVDVKRWKDKMAGSEGKNVISLKKNKKL